MSQGLQLALEEESEKAREGFRKMESLLEVARREQAKTAVQLQHLQQQAERDKERAVEAVELSKAQVTACCVPLYLFLHISHACRLSMSWTCVGKSYILFKWSVTY